MLEGTPFFDEDAGEKGEERMTELPPVLAEWGGEEKSLIPPLESELLLCFE